MRYIIFWIPLEYKTNFSTYDIDIQDIKSKDITDNVEEDTNQLTLQILENKSLKINYQENIYNLDYCSSNNNGYFIYSFDCNIDEELLKIQVYHLFKEFYHNHKSHNKEEDALLEGYIYLK